jgi:hypothetical protein
MCTERTARVFELTGGGARFDTEVLSTNRHAALPAAPFPDTTVVLDVESLRVLPNHLH